MEVGRWMGIDMGGWGGWWKVLVDGGGRTKGEFVKAVFVKPLANDCV